MTTPTPPLQTIQIGKTRRITLDELAALSRGDAKLELVDVQEDDTTDDNNNSSADNTTTTVTAADLLERLSSLSLNDTTTTNKLSAEATIVSLALLSLSLAKGGRNGHADCRTVRMVDLVNAIIATNTANGSSTGATTVVRLVVDPAGFARGVDSLLAGGALGIEDDGGGVERMISLARISLMLARARSLSSKSVSDAVASLSVERLGKYLSLEPYSARNFDELRPHRGCIESAAVLRACLQGSTSVNVAEKTVAAVPATETVVAAAVDHARTVPQYHGPAREAIAAACKTMELEMNCSVGVGRLDDTVALLAGNSALGGIRAMADGSAKRSGNNGIIASIAEGSALEELASNLETSVDGFERALEAEATLGCEFVARELARKEAELKAKEEEKARRKADGGGGGNPNSNANNNAKEDEFAGMSDKQKAKILKKRAEKEAKAAAKRKAKEAKASGGNAALSSIFGAGTTAIYPLLSSSSSSSNGTAPTLSDPALLTKLELAIDALLSGGMQRKPKVPKGTRDYLPEQMAIRDQAFTTIRRVFKRHGAVEIDTPVFELKETLTGKYGEDSKLIYDLADQGGEMLALRYDLTVPFARFLAVNAVGNIKRYHIGKVYRRDQPALSRGRYREFYQCDFDIAGSYGRMVPDSECLVVACEILDGLPIGDFGIKLNHRRLLDAILDICGVPADKFRTICSAVDKLDKEPWSEVRREMVEEKGLAGDVADQIGEFVVLKGEPWEMYNSLMGGNKFGKHQGAMDAMEDLRICFEYLEAMDKLKFISFDLSLARGLDYYTGVIYEAVCMNGNTQVGSIGGGGRYDNLVSMFQEAGKVTPCVGVSVGIERVFTLMEERLREQQGGSIKQPNVTVLVASAGENLLPQRMKLTKILWDANISAEFSQQENPKLKFEIANALDRQIPFMVISGEEEAREGKCKVKDLKARTEETVDVSDLVKTLREKGVVPVGCEFAMEMLGGNSK